MDNLLINNLSNNTEFRNRVKIGMLLAATEISGEEPTDRTTIELSKRHNLATACINNAQQKMIIFANACAVQPGLNTVITINQDGSLNYTGVGTIDSDISFTVATVWNDVSGVSYADEQPII